MIGCLGVNFTALFSMRLNRRKILSFEGSLILPPVTCRREKNKINLTCKEKREKYGKIRESSSENLFNIQQSFD
jgi:hypothetical protein